MKLAIGFLGAGALVAIGHFALVATAYPTLPPQLPAFLDWAGKPVWLMPTTPLSACRLALMGLAAQAACVSMAAAAVEEEQREPHQALWAAVSCVVACKMLLSTMSVLQVDAGLARIGVLVLSLLGSLALLAYGWRLYQRLGAAYVLSFDRRTAAQVGVAFLAYAVFTAMPVWLPG